MSTEETKFSRKARFKNSGLYFWTDLIFFDKEINLRAGSLTFFTLSGIVPICAFFVWVADFLMADVSVSRMATLIFPDVGDSLETLTLFPKIRIGQLLHSFAGWVAVLLILFYVHVFFNNMQYAFNYIWQSEDRTNKWLPSLKFNIVLTMALFIMVMVFSFLFNICQSTVLQYLLSFLLLFFCVYFTFRALPYDKKPLKLPAAITAFGVTVALVLWSRLIPLVGEQLSEFEFSGIDILLLIFWLYWAWFIVLSGARVCAYMSNRGIDYMRTEVENLAPEYRMYLSILTASYVFKNSVRHNDGSHGLSFDDIHKKMFIYPGQKYANSRAFLPMSLLDSIIKDLMSRGVLQKCADRKQFYYEPGADIDERKFTVGDLLFALNFGGGYDLQYDYQALNSTLESALSSSLLSTFSGLDTRLMEICPDNCSLDDDSDSPDSFTYESKKAEYESRKQHLREQKYEDSYRHALKLQSADKIIEGILLSPEGIFEPSKEYHISLIRRLEAENRKETETPGTDPNSPSQEEKKPAPGKSIFDRLFR